MGQSIFRGFHDKVWKPVSLLSLMLWGLWGGFSVLSADQKTFADVTLAPVFQEGMLLQRDLPVPVWGTAEPGQTVIVKFGAQTKTAVAAVDGTWKLFLDAMPANARGETLAVNYQYPKGYTNTYEDLVFKDLLLGDVWLLMGQSNMEFGINSVATVDQELADATWPAMRTLLMPKATAPFPATGVDATWMQVDPDNITTGGWNGFSGVGFIFGRRIHKETGVPVGLIQAAYGGCPIQTFISREEFATNKAMSRDNKAIQKVDETWAADKAGNSLARHPWDGITEYSKLKPSIAWNAMVSPILPLRIKGVLWYQGESNVGTGKIYTTYMKALINSLRVAFQNQDLPVYFAQIAPWKYGGSLTTMWESQFDALSVPGTGIALTVDVGDAGDIHPTRKHEVGERFALQALHGAYGRTALDPDGPVAVSMQRDGSSLVITFDHAASGLKTTDGKAVLGFRISDVSMKPGDFKDAQAVIKGNTVVVSFSGMSDPTMVRYAWEDTPAVNLVDLDGLPARPFTLKLSN